MYVTDEFLLVDFSVSVGYIVYSNVRVNVCSYQALVFGFWLRLIKQGMMLEYAKNLADFAVAYGKKHVVVLSSLDFGRWQTIDMSR